MSTCQKENGDNMNTLDAIKNRYSCRSFSDRKVSQEQIETLIQAANAAPAASNNYKNHKLTIIRDENIISEIDVATAKEFPQISDHPTFDAPILMVLSIKPNNAFPMIPYCNVSCAAENIMLAATDLGLASVFVMGIPLVLQKKADLLNKLHIDNDLTPAISLLVGYAKNKTDVHKLDKLIVDII